MSLKAETAHRTSSNGDRLCGVIDWSDICLTDAAQDFRGLMIWLGALFVEQVLKCYTPKVDPEFPKAEARCEMIRPVTSADCEAIARIYNHYIANTIITFEEQVLEPSDILARIREVESASLPWLVAEVDGKVVGYAYANKWKTRSAHRFSVETTVYLDPDHLGKGLGSMLYEELFSILRSKGVHVAIAGIALPNEASVALSEKFGMEKAAHFREVGYKFGRWIDVGYWQRIL